MKNLKIYKGQRWNGQLTVHVQILPVLETGESTRQFIAEVEARIPGIEVIEFEGTTYFSSP